jgi:hypothetical protein
MPFLRRSLDALGFAKKGMKIGIGKWMNPIFKNSIISFGSAPP